MIFVYWKQEDAEMKTLIILAVVGLVLAAGSAHLFGEDKGVAPINAELQDITNGFQDKNGKR